MSWLRKALKVTLEVLKKAELVVHAIKAAIELIDPPKPDEKKKE